MNAPLKAVHFEDPIALQVRAISRAAMRAMWSRWSATACSKPKVRARWRCVTSNSIRCASTTCCPSTARCTWAICPRGASSPLEDPAHRRALRASLPGAGAAHRAGRRCPHESARAEGRGGDRGGAPPLHGDARGAEAAFLDAHARRARRARRDPRNADRTMTVRKRSSPPGCQDSRIRCSTTGCRHSRLGTS